MKAAGLRNTELVSLLLEQPGIDVNAKNSLGKTALHMAVRNGTPAILRLLLDFPGIDREAKDGEATDREAKDRVHRGLGIPRPTHRPLEGLQRTLNVNVVGGIV